MDNPSGKPLFNDMKNLLAQIASGNNLDEESAYQAFEIIMSGDATPAQIGGFLMGLRVRGETVAEITGAARVMRARVLPVRAPENAIDIVGTGGDGQGSWNISSGAALIVAACGVPVAKHGNRALSSRSGAADILTALGVNIEVPIPIIERAIAEVGIGFLMAPRHHSAMRHVLPARIELGTRTIFNLLGPLTNPAGVKKLMIGVFAPDWIEPLAEVIGRLGSERAWIVHGSDGLDEITTTGPTFVAEWYQGKIKRFTLTPEEFGLSRARPEQLKGGDPHTNAAALRNLLAGDKGAYRDIVLFNAAAALTVSGTSPDMAHALARATAALDNGTAHAKLKHLIAICT